MYGIECALHAAHQISRAVHTKAHPAKGVAILSLLVEAETVVKVGPGQREPHPLQLRRAGRSRSIVGSRRRRRCRCRYHLAPTIQAAALVQSPQTLQRVQKWFRRDVSACHLQGVQQRRLGLLQFAPVALLLEEGGHLRSHHLAPGWNDLLLLMLLLLLLLLVGVWWRWRGRTMSLPLPCAAAVVRVCGTFLVVFGVGGPQGIGIRAGASAVQAAARASTVADCWSSSSSSSSSDPFSFCSSALFSSAALRSRWMALRISRSSSLDAPPSRRSSSMPVMAAVEE
mmetsp:Transcript_5559/g.13342  ORF Transcript_5559/g.13342 Transcript_5559/m.13342 type:complete len:284 (+) Transcript_5559:1491-2342(+)